MKKKSLKSDFKDSFWNLQQMNEVTRHFCWNQNFVPWGPSAPAPGLYTCINSWKKMYKIRLQRDFFLNLQQMTEVTRCSIDIKISSPRGCQPLPRGYIHVWNNEKKCIKSDLKEIFLKLVANDRSDKWFMLTLKFWPLGLSAPYMQLSTFIKTWKDVYKVRGWWDSF